jgi:hypothetical protein
MSKEKPQIDLIKDRQRSTDDIVLEESDIWEVKNKIRIPYNGKLWEYGLTTLISITPPLQDKVEPTLKLVGSFISRDPITALEKIILDCKNAKDI